MIRVEFKLFADLMRYLPADARQQSTQVDLPDNATVYDLMERFQVPKEQAHLVICNGLFIPPSQRDSHRLRDKDVIALWPPVAGG